MTLSKAQLQHADELTRKHRERAEAIAEREWRRVVDGLPDGFQPDLAIEEVFKRCARLAYLAGKQDALDDTAAMMAANKERRRLREAGRDPAAEN